MRLYRFEDMVGNTNQINLIRKSLSSKSFPQVVIMEGEPGTGKSTSAEIAGLYLTCISPKNGEPCLECENCKRNLIALKNPRESGSLVKKNMGEITGRKDVLDLIKQIFVLQSPIGNSVYIIEEPHVLKPDDQTALLEEIDKINPNTYIILCTTEAYKLIKPLRDRATIFSFRTLNKQERKVLFERVCFNSGITGVSKDVADMIQKYSKGVPRSMVNLIKFISESKPTHAEIVEHLGHINTEEFSDLFMAMTIAPEEGYKALKHLTESYSFDKLLIAFKEYLLEMAFYVKCGISENLTKKDKQIINKVIDTTVAFKLCSIFEDVTPYNTTATDLKIKLMKVMMLVEKRTPTDVIRDSSSMASKQKQTAQRIVREKTEMDRYNQTVEKLDKNDFMNFFNK